MDATADDVLYNKLAPDYMADGEYQPKGLYTKEMDLTRDVIESLALFVYKNSYSGKGCTLEVVLEVYNVWAANLGFHASSAKSVASILDYIRQLLLLDADELETALRFDQLIPIVPIIPGTPIPKHDIDRGGPIPGFHMGSMEPSG